MAEPPSGAVSGLIMLASPTPDDQGPKHHRETCEQAREWSSVPSSADDLIEGQYRDRPHLRPILDVILAAASGLGPVTIQARKTYVSLMSPRRTFARVQPATKQRVDLALRLEGVKPGGRLQPSRIHETMPLQISLTRPDDVDPEVLGWLQQAYDQNR